MDEVAMDSLLSPMIANFFMVDFEEMVLNRVVYKPICWFHYSDTTFMMSSWTRITE
jgi:hypothetical protein